MARILSGQFKGQPAPPGQRQMWLGLFERETAPWCRKLVVGCVMGIDIGARDGLYAQWMLNRGLPRVLAIDVFRGQKNVDPRLELPQSLSRF